MKNLKKLIATLCLLAAMLLPQEAVAEKSIYIPTLSGTFRARYEYLTKQNLGAFKVRDLRIGIDGYVAPIMSYRGEVDFSDWGKITLVDAFVKVLPTDGLYFSLGMQRIPFTIAAHRMPCQQYFVDRTFLAKHAGVRDIGLTGGYTFRKFPFTAQAGFFNCSGTGEHKTYFTRTYGFSVKLISPFLPNWYTSVSTARLKKGLARSQNWDAGAYFDNGLWHVEAEYMRKNYVHNVLKPVNAFDFFVYRNFPIEKKLLGGVSAAARYDYMSDHSSGLKDDNDKFIIDNPECHRITLGATLTLKSKFQADIRLNYEKYFFKKGVVPNTSDDDKLVLELIAHF